MATTLKIFLIIYIIYALLKFYEFFFRKKETRMKGLKMVYDEGNGRIVKIFDNVMLLLMEIAVVLNFLVGIEYLRFTTGLLVGMTVIQIFFHRFSDPLPEEQAPPPPFTALKMMSYSIQAQPVKAWRELLFMSILFL